MGSSPSGKIAVAPQSSRSQAQAQPQPLLYRPTPHPRPKQKPKKQSNQSNGIIVTFGGGKKDSSSQSQDDQKNVKKKSQMPRATFQPFKYKEVKPTAQDNKLAQEIMGGFEVQRLMREKLDSLVYTSEHQESIINEIVKGVFKLQQGQTDAEKNFVFQLMSNMEQEDWYFHKTVKKLKKLTHKFAKFETLSRIYYYIANIKRQKSTDREFTNNLGVKECITNKYEKLSEAQVDEIVGYEAASQKILELGATLNFKLNSIERDSHRIVHMLAQVSSRHQKDIQGFKYDLSPQEYKKVAHISRNACNHHDNGVVVLFIYFVKTCRKLQKDGQSVSSIEKKLDEAIQWMSKEYPPGEGLDDEKKQLDEALADLEHEEQFFHLSAGLSKQEDKQTQLENIILDYAYTAKLCRDDFEDLVKQTCFKNAIQTKVGLRLNPSNPDKRAMMRIKENMLFGKAQKIEKKTKDTIQQTIDGEDKDYQEAIDSILKEKKEITFKISDMVRGKCVFPQMGDLILTVNQIKKFIKDDKKKRFRIIEIVTRFTYILPINDVIIKIAINQQIVSELHLTIQANAAAYNFAHEVYELARIKVFSKIKRTHNYFQEFAGDFKAQASKALDVAKRESLKTTDEEERGGKEADLKEKYGILVKHTVIISQLLDLQSMESPSNYQEVMAKSIAEINGKLEGLTVSTDKKLQKLMAIIFRMQLGTWKKELGKEIDQVQKSEEYPPLLKSTLLYYFYKSFDISKQVMSILQFYPNYKLSLNKKGKEEREIKDNYIDMYLQQNFALEKPFENIRSTARLFYKAHQIQQITIQKTYPHVPSKLVVKKIIQGVILEESNPEIIDFLSQLLFSFFLARGHQPNAEEDFNSYNNHLMQLLNKKSKRSRENISSYMLKFLKAQQLLEKRNRKQAQEASKLLKEISKIHHGNGDIEQELLWNLLSSEIKSYQSDFNSFENQYEKNVAKKAEDHGIELRGFTVANSEYRIYQQLLEKKKNSKNNSEGLNKALKIHLSKALTASSRSEGEEWLYKAVKADLKDHLQDQVIHENRAVTFVNISYNQEFKGDKMIYLEKSRWPELLAFYCIKRDISDKGCEHLSRAGFTKLTLLELGENRIGVEGCKHLSKADWKNLSSLNLEKNKIDGEACGYLSKANWKDISILRLNSNKLTDEGFQALAKADWPKLVTLKMSSCEVSDVACMHLSKVNWKSISDFDLEDNKIGHEGCGHLVKANFNSLVTFNLSDNEIGDKGCGHLVMSSWDKLYSLSLKNNNIGVKGCEHLSKTNWPKLDNFNLQGNKIFAEGCENLISRKWKHRSTLDLRDNQINNKEKALLNELWYQNHPYIRIYGL